MGPNCCLVFATDAPELSHHREPIIGCCCYADSHWSTALSDSAQPARVGEYRAQAAMLRSLAFRTRFHENRIQLLALADSFDKLADQVEVWEILAAAAD